MSEMNADAITNKPIQNIILNPKGPQQQFTATNVTKSIKVGNSVMLHPAPDTTENHGSQATVPMHNDTASAEESTGAAPPPPEAPTTAALTLEKLEKMQNEAHGSTTADTSAAVNENAGDNMGKSSEETSSSVTTGAGSSSLADDGTDNAPPTANIANSVHSSTTASSNTDDSSTGVGAVVKSETDSSSSIVRESQPSEASKGKVAKAERGYSDLKRMQMSSNPLAQRIQVPFNTFAEKSSFKSDYSSPTMING